MITAPQPQGRRRTAALLVVLLGMFMDLLDVSIVNVTLPSIHRDLGGSRATVQWIVAGYTLALGAALITGGRLGDLYGRKRLYISGTASFTLASLACGLAGSTAELIAFRVGQGLAAALMLPQVLSLVQAMYAPDERGRAISGFGWFVAVATVGGPILGAVLTTGDVAGLGWRAVFLVNIPIGAVTILLAALVLPESATTAAERVDLPGTVLSTAALICLIYPLIQGRAPFPAGATALLAGSVPLTAALVLQQRARTRRTGTSQIRLDLFRHRSFTGGLLVGLLFGSAVGGFLLAFTLYLQDGLGYAPLRAGLTGTPWTLAVPVSAAVGARLLAPRLGRLVLQIGLALDAAAMLTLMAAVWRGHHSAVDLMPGLAVGGVGMGFVVVPAAEFTLAEVSPADAGSASGLLNTVQQIGCTLGTAAVGTRFIRQPGRRIPPSCDLALVHTLELPLAAFMAALAATFLLPSTRHISAFNHPGRRAVQAPSVIPP